MAATTKYIPRMKAHYLNTVRADLMKQLELQNPMQVPTIEKIVINMGVGRATQQASLLDGAVADLTAITGQKPLVTKS
ncbi:MAG: 50S ribosomal protein L5, partial [Ilumatobacteraceae bacterium]